MVQIASNRNMDFSQFNLNVILGPGFGNGTFSGFENDFSIDSNDFPEVIDPYDATSALVYWDGVSNFDNSDQYFGIFGRNYSYTSAGDPKGGTVTGLLYEGNFTETGSDYFYILDFTTNLTTLLNLAETPDGADDQAWLRSILSGKDTITGSGEADNVFGAGGNDSLTGNNGGDTMAGEDGNDRLDGGNGNDNLSGGAGADHVMGGAGSDKIAGGDGQDQLYGGTDTTRDLFIFAAAADSATGSTRDRIFDFTSGTDDIDLKKIDANSATGTNDSFVFAGQKPTANAIWAKPSGGDMIVSGDVDGDKLADFSIRVVGVSALEAGDFIL